MSDDSDWSDKDDGGDDSDNEIKRKERLRQMKSNADATDHADVPCKVCSKAVVYHSNTALRIDGTSFHKSCFRCGVSDIVLSAGSYAGIHDQVFCKPHFQQKFKEKGNYSESFGVENPKDKWKNNK